VGQIKWKCRGGQNGDSGKQSKGGGCWKGPLTHGGGGMWHAEFIKVLLASDAAGRRVRARGMDRDSH
jgi:hypothetical protein